VREGDETERFQDKDFRVGGDVITAVEGKAVRSESDLAKALLVRKPGDTITVAIRRGDKRLNVRIKLGERPLDSPRRG
jgi:S1-C subfamily serine protease